MIEVLVKGIILEGFISQPSHKYDDSECFGPSDSQVEAIYEKTNKFLRDHPETHQIMPEQINPIPLIREGAVGIPAAANFYIWRDFLIANLYGPAGNIFSGEVGYCIWAAGRASDEETIDKILQGDMKREGSGIVYTPLASYVEKSFWEDLEPRRVWVPSWGREQILESLVKLVMPNQEF